MSETKIDAEVAKKTTKKSAKGNGSSPVDSIIEAVEKLTVLELVDLVKTLEDKFGVSASAPVLVAAPQAGIDGGEAKAAEEEKTEFTVVLTAYGEKKIQVIKVVREITGLGLKEAKELVDKAPSNVKEGIVKEDAESIKKKIEDVGGSVELK